MIGNKQYTKAAIILLLVLFSLGSCKKYFEVDLNASEIPQDRVFNDDGNANSAVAGIYYTMVGSSLFGGGISGLSALAGLSADELYNFENGDPYRPFYENNLLPDNEYVEKFWNEAYSIIYQANALIDGLNNSSNVSEGLKNQLIGECYFVRALCHFYLVNLFGEIPVVTTSDYRTNSKVSRTSIDVVYNQMIEDLKLSQTLLSENYPEPERVRPNRYAATALLARVYLFAEQWENAITEASTVIDRPELEMGSPDVAFLLNSNETIFQLASEDNFNTLDAGAFLIIGAPSPYNYCLEPSLVSTFDETDLRRVSWISSFTDLGTGTDIFYPSKYKAETIAPTSEYYIVLRLPEQYLIRAEAYLHNGNIDAALSDINKIRERAGENLIEEGSPAATQEALTEILHEERRKELFSEWGHRWFDLKRTGQANAVLEPIKENWSTNDQLYPIPQLEFRRNPFLGKQNQGY